MQAGGRKDGGGRQRLVHAGRLRGRHAGHPGAAAHGAGRGRAGRVAGVDAEGLLRLLLLAVVSGWGSAAD